MKRCPARDERFEELFSDVVGELSKDAAVE
jgi:hypothetical protein